MIEDLASDETKFMNSTKLHGFSSPESTIRANPSHSKPTRHSTEQRSQTSDKLPPVKSLSGLLAFLTEKSGVSISWFIVFKNLLVVVMDGSVKR